MRELGEDEEDVLHEILGGVVVGEQALAEGEEREVVAVVRDGESVELAAADARDEVGLEGGFGRRARLPYPFERQRWHRRQDPHPPIFPNPCGAFKRHRR